VTRLLLGIAWVAYALSWFLRAAHAEEFGTPYTYAGWKAFTTTVSVILRPQDADWSYAVGAAGVLGNVAVLLSPLMLSRTPPRWLVASLLAAFILNLGWILVVRNVASLDAGYWLWVGSMGLMALAAIHARLRAARATPT
jgi:hypothetical protein